MTAGLTNAMTIPLTAQTGQPAAGGTVVPVAPAVSDETLVERLRGGDVAAGEALARRYYESLMRYLQRLGGGSQLAEELYQQTWLAVLEHLDRFDPGTCNGAANGAAAGTGAGGGGTGAVSGGFKAWLFRIATNKAHDHWRSRGRERAAKEGLRLLADEELPPASFKLEGSEQEQRLRRAIAQLPENQRQVLLLRYYSNMKFVEIAKLLGCPLNTALGRVHKAMIKLRQLMDE